MANKPGLVARIMGRTPKNPIVTKLFTAAIGQPLLVHPGLGEALIGGYLSGAVDMREPLVEAIAGPTPADGADTGPNEVRVLNISGALVNRPMPDACGQGPLSYEAIGEAFDAALADQNVKAIILRAASPGGMASGCFDLTDRLFAAKGTKPVYAMVDDYAYSGAYAVIAPCDEIWVSRTSGVGSIGVIYWHLDQTAADAKAGLKVTPIFSGDRKADLNPHIPLSPEAAAQAQAEVDRLRTLFVGAVATYRGVDPQVVFDTQAGTFHGEEAVAAGLADKVGTMRDLLAYINAPAEAEDQAANDDDGDVDADTTAPDDVPANDADADAVPNAAAAEQSADDAPRMTADGVTEGEAAIAEVMTRYPEAFNAAITNLEMHEAGQTFRFSAQPLPAPAASAELTPEQLAKLDLADKAIAIAEACPDRVSSAIAQVLIAIDFPAIEAEARIEHARKVADLCAAAHLDEAAPGYVTRHTGLEQVRAELAAAVAVDPLPQLVTSLNTGPKDTRRTTLHEDVYSRRRAAAAGTGN